MTKGGGSEPATLSLFLPYLKWLVDWDHTCGLKAMLHCYCGFAPLIPALVEIELDALQSLWPDGNGLGRGLLPGKARGGCRDENR